MDLVLLSRIFSITMTVAGGVVFALSFKSKNPIYRPLKLLLLCSLLADVSFRVAFHLFDYYVLSGPIYRILELIIVIELYYTFFDVKKLKWLKLLMQTLPPLVLTIIEPLDSGPVRTTSSIIFSILATFYFVKITRELKVETLTAYPIFWINSGFLIYFAGSLFLFLLFEPLGKLHETSAIVTYMFHNFLGISKNILLGIAFYKACSLEKVNFNLS